MKLVIPYVGDMPVQAIAGVNALDILAVDVEPHLVKLHEDTDYFDLLARLWNEQKSFILVEHDIIVTEAAIVGLVECPKTWCSCPYPWYDHMLHGLGCTKFDKQIMQEYPLLFDEIANVSNDVHPAKHWCNIDDRMRRYLGGFMRNDHQHTTPVGHLRPYASHGCVVR